MKNEATLVIVIIFKFAHDKEKGKRKKDESFFVTTVQGRYKVLVPNNGTYLTVVSGTYVQCGYILISLDGYVLYCTVVLAHVDLSNSQRLVILN